MVCPPRLPAIWRSQRASVLTEVALALPVLLLVIAGVVDFGFLIREGNKIIETARVAARSGAAKSAQFPADCNVPPITFDCAAPGISSITNRVARSAIQGGCDYLEREGFDRADWQISVTSEVYSLPRSTALQPGPNSTGRALKVEVAQSEAQSHCIFCWQNFFNALAIKGRSDFSIQVRQCN